jgi:hypothetical protein
MPNGAYNVMLDPSMLFDPDASERIQDQLGSLRDEGAQVFLPYAFIEFLASVNSGNITPDGIDRFVGFFMRGEVERRPLDEMERRPPEGLYDLVERLQGEGLVSYYRARGDAAAPHLGVRYYLNEELWPEHQRGVGIEGADYYHLPDTLFDAWVFLQEESWIVAKFRHAFDQMVRAGGIALQWGKRPLDLAVRKTRGKKEQEALTKIDRLTALGKWVAMGGIAAVDAGLISISPPAGALFAVNVAPAVFFFLIDP